MFELEALQTAYPIDEIVEESDLSDDGLKESFIDLSANLQMQQTVEWFCQVQEAALEKDHDCSLSGTAARPESVLYI